MTTWRRALLGLALAGLACGGGSSKRDPSADVDGDGHPAAEDCDDDNPGVWQLLPGYRDADHDGYGAGPVVQVCSGAALLVGYAGNAGDCDDTTEGAWQAWTAYADLDGDGFGAGPPVLLCIGSLPPQWYSADDTDCDDSAPAAHQLDHLYVDADGDGVGAGELVEVCAGDVAPYGYARTTGDCAPEDRSRWKEAGYLWRDADGDGAYVASAGVVCSGAALPGGYTMGPVSMADCDDASAAVWASTTAYPDADRDGVGAGTAVTLCTNGVSLPAGYAASSSDCAPQDGTLWRMASYWYRDADGDGATVWAPGTVCAGDAFPAGYATGAGVKGNDCDDAREDRWSQLTGYVDADGDGVGAGAGVAVCTDGTLPDGIVASGTDCAPDDPAAWRSYAYTYRDADGDGVVVYASGTVCGGAEIPAGYLTSSTGLYDCDDGDPAISRTVYGYADADGDGVGAGTSLQSCTAGSLPAGQVATGTDCAPDDASRWRMLSYAGRDEDGDGFSTRVTGSVCSGAALPPTYVATAAGNDCDDRDPALWRWVVLYPDQDGDGIGAPPRIIPCLGAALPEGYSLFGWDPDDGDPAVREATDDDLL